VPFSVPQSWPESQLQGRDVLTITQAACTGVALGQGPPAVVPYTDQTCMGDDLPKLIRLPFKVAEVALTAVAAKVVTTGPCGGAITELSSTLTVSSKQIQPATRITENLIEREIEVLRLVARGMSYAEISRELFVSEGTVRNYISNVMAKLGVSDRTQATVIANQHGLGDCVAYQASRRRSGYFPVGSLRTAESGNFDVQD